MRSLLPCLVVLTSPIGFTPAAPPGPPADFVQPQSPTRPVPFPIKYVDQGQFDSRLKGLQAPEGFRVEIMAESPVITNPVGMTFGPDGTMFVMEWSVDPVTQGRWFEFKETFRYRDGTTKQVATMKKFVTDPVKVLKLNTATGTYDKFETIIAEELPSTLLHHDGWLYTTGRGTVRRYKQSRLGGPWDIKEIIAQGFCGFHHHQVSGLTIGNDGKLYITSGDDDNFVEGSDGSRATVLRTGAIFRCNPDGSEMEAFSLGYRNPYRDLAYDSKFNWFHADNDNEDGSKFTGCRLVHVAEGIDYGWRLKTGARCCRPDFARGAVAGELPGKLPPMLKTGRGAPAGVLIYNDTRLPEQYRGLIYYPDVFRKLVRAYTVEPKGASFEVTHEFEFLKSDDPLFRPCQMVTGPDGAIYVVDWRTNSGGAGRLSGDGEHGRIYRIRWAGTKQTPAIQLRGMDSWENIIKLPDDLLVERLSAPDFTDRVEARKELVRRGEKVQRLVLSRLISGSFTAEARLVALGVLMAHWNEDVEDLFRLLLNDTSPDVRRIAADALGQNAKKQDTQIHTALARLLTDDSPVVRRTAALAIGRIGADGAADSLVAAWKSNDSQDPFLTDGYHRAIERLGQPGLDALMAVAQSGKREDLDRVATAFATFRTRPALDVLPQLMASDALTPERRADLVRSYANYQFDPPMSLDPMASFLTSRPEESAGVKIAALEVLAGTGEVTTPSASAFVLDLLDATDAETRLAAVRTVEETRLELAVDKLIAILADPKREASERLAVLRALRTTAGPSAIAPLVDLLNRTEPAALKIDALRALATADPAKARPIAVKLLDQKDPALLAEAIVVLGSTRDGARIVGERYVEQKLPRDLFPRVSEVLNKFASDPAMSKLYGEVMKGGLLVSLDPRTTEQIKKLVDANGDPAKGKTLYLNTAVLACATCHQMEGVGGNVGPDLSRVWDTHTLEKVLEAIVEPSKEIKEGYQSFKAVTLDGQVFTGLRVTDTAREVVIREASGRDVRIPKDNLDSIDPQKVSLMPDNVVSQLSFEQFVDLLAFLKSRSSQESLRGLVVEYSVVTGFKPNFRAVEGPEENPSTAARLKGTKAAWQILTADASGTLDLAGILPEERSAAYVLTHVYSPTRQTVTLHLTADDAVNVWVNKKSVFEKPPPLIPYPRPVDEEIEVTLPSGWTPVVIKVVTTGKQHRIGLQVKGENIRTAAKPDEK